MDYSAAPLRQNGVKPDIRSNRISSVCYSSVAQLAEPHAVNVLVRRSNRLRGAYAVIW